MMGKTNLFDWIIVGEYGTAGCLSAIIGFILMIKEKLIASVLFIILTILMMIFIQLYQINRNIKNDGK